MVYYVALIAILNLGLGYALAVYLGASRTRLATTAGDTLEALDSADADLAE